MAHDQWLHRTLSTGEAARLLVSVMMWGCAGAAIAACDADGIRSAERPVLVIQDEVTFPAGQPGQVQERSVRISNGGDGTLEVFEFEVIGPQGVFEVEGLEGLTLEPQEDNFLTFRYTAFTAEQVSGRLYIDSNGDPEGEDETTVRINIAEPVPRLFIAPSPVDFGRVPSGTSASRDVGLINIGTTPVTITEVFPLDPFGEFTVDAADLAALPRTLARNENWIVTVNYAPLNDYRDEIPMEVEYLVDGDDYPRKEEVILLANGPAPCITVTHEEGFSFGPSLLNETRAELFTITNCSTGDNAQDLVVSSLALLNTAEQASSPAFALANAPALPLTLSPAEIATFDVTYTPTTLDVGERAWLEIVSNDTVKTPLVFEITGVGSIGACPVARVRCSVRGGSDEPSGELTVPALTTVDCAADVTGDPIADGEIEYRWSLERPVPSEAALDAPDGSENSFFVDSLGSYAVALTAVDSVGEEACAFPAVTITARPEEDIFVEMFWTLPDGSVPPDDFGRGADVDLHLLHVSRGCWNSTPWDCHWRNTTPDWGVAGDRADDPQLAVDMNVLGSLEQVSLDQPEVATYRIGVEYFDDHGWGAVNATVRVYVFGSLVFERSQALPASKSFWEVAEISWPDGLVSDRNRTWPFIVEALCP